MTEREYWEARERLAQLEDQRDKAMIFSAEYQQLTNEISSIENAPEYIEAKKKGQRGDLCFTKAFWWEGVPMKTLSGEPRKKAMDRLNAIPSEMEVIKLLYDWGKILYYDPTTDRSVCGYPDHYDVNWWDYYESIDVRFVEKNRSDPNLTYLAGIDVKNVGLNNKGEDYPNVYLETQKKDRGEAEYKLKGWAWHFYKSIEGEPLRNRYIAYVRNGKEFFGSLATETPVYSDDRSELENKRAIVDYYFARMAELDHEIMIVYCSDILKYLDSTGGTDVRKRTMDMIQGGAPNVKARTCKFEIWDKQYMRLMLYPDQASPYRWRWEQKGCTKLQVKAQPPEITRDRTKINEHLAALEDQQRGSLKLETIHHLFGLSENLKTKDELIAEWKARWNYDALPNERKPEWRWIF